MKKGDLLFILICIGLLVPFIPFSFLKEFQTEFLYSKSYWVLTSFLKFALLATLGEVIGYRIKTGHYPVKPFGVVPRAII